MTRTEVLKHNALQLLIALDQSINATIGALLALLRLARIWPRPVCHWWADETISAHCWRWHVNGVRSWPCRVVDTLFFWDADHCKNSFESERQGRHLPPECRV